MFIGHLAVGFASKRAAPDVSLGWLISAAMLPDLLFPLFMLIGLESVRIVPGGSGPASLEFINYPVTHSLAASVGWALGAGLAYWFGTRALRGAVVLSLGVLSHWFLDALTHRPDMPLYPGGPMVGAGLWNSLAATVVVEGGMFVVGLWVYLVATRSVDRIGTWALRVWVVLLAFLYWKHVAGPPPPSGRAFELVGFLAGLLFPLWAWWIDRHRRPVSRTATAPGR